MNTPFQVTLPNLEKINADILADAESKKNKKFVIKTTLFLSAIAVAIPVGIYLLDKLDAKTPYAD